MVYGMKTPLSLLKLLKKVQAPNTIASNIELMSMTRVKEIQLVLAL